MRLSLLWVISALASWIGLVQADTLHLEKSLYKNILIYESDGIRCMKFGRHHTGRQTCINLMDRDYMVFNYTKMIMGALYLNPAPQRVLVIGLGGGVLPTALQKLYPTIQIDAIEIDPAVVRVAIKFFDFNPGKQVHIIEQDGRVFVKHALKQNTRYDLIILDAFDHEYIPEHLLTKEFITEVRGLLADKGVLAANTFINAGLYPHESATYHSALGDFYNIKKGNRVILFRANGLPDRTELVKNAIKAEEKLRVFGVSKQWLLPLFSTEKDWPTDIRIFTDQYSPSNLLLEQH